MKSAGILLAAGSSQRLGQPKQLLRLGGEPLIHRAARVLLEGGCAPVYVVLGEVAEECRHALGDLPVQTTFNENWRGGMGTSVAAGIAALTAQTSAIEAAIIAVCDQPFLSAELISALIYQRQSGECSIVACNYGEALGPPALFTAVHFGELQQLRGEMGARGLFGAHANETVRVPFPQGHIDIDEVADTAALLQ